MKILVGYTGFVGSNLIEKTKFDFLFNSKNINEAFGLNPEICVYAGIKAEKYIANANEVDDFNLILNAIENIKKINPKKLILISTIDVYSQMGSFNEDHKIQKNGMQPYGKNRIFLEEWVETNLVNYLIIRLPGLYGKNIKKNFIYDYIQFIPSKLSERKFTDLVSINFEINQFYSNQSDGFYQCKILSELEKMKLIQIFKEIGFSALNFTDSRIEFQFT